MSGQPGYADFIKITILGLAISALWNGMGSIIMPLRVLDVAGETRKNTYLGLLTFTGLVLAVIVQPLAGAFSDSSRSIWGRRRPYILAGMAAAVILLPLLGLSGSYAALFSAYCLLQIASNTAHGPWQGLIPDLVPASRRGRTAGVKGLMEALGALAGIQLVGYFLSGRFAGPPGSSMGLALAVLAFLMLGTMLVTILTVKEQPGGKAAHPGLRAVIYTTFKIDCRSNPGFIPFLVSRFLFLMPLVVLRNFGLYMLSDFICISDPVAAVADLMVVVGICSIVLVYPAGRLSDRVGRRTIVSGAGITGAAGIILIYAAHSYPGVMAGGALLGIANGAFMSANWAMATDLVTEGAEARYLGLTNLATAGASAIANLTGPVIDLLNTFSLNLGYQVILLSCAVFFTASSLLMLRTRDKA
jgi:MFS family permease